MLRVKRTIRLNVVVPVYNEEEALGYFDQKLREVLSRMEGVRWRVVYVNDGSTDKSRRVLDKLEKKSKRRVKVVHLAGNFGQEAAMLAGIDEASGEAVVCMDADLQHPPELIGKMLNEFRRGKEIVLMRRKMESDVGWVRKVLSGGFYWFYNLTNKKKLEVNVSDFYLISDRVVKVLRQQYRERRRLMRAILQSLGFETVILEYRAGRRKWGESKYPLKVLLGVSSQSILAYSSVGLHLSLLASGLFALFSVGLVVFSVVTYLMGYNLPGFTTIVVFMSGMAAVQFLILGIMCYYLGVVIAEVKGRPIYVREEEV